MEEILNWFINGRRPQFILYMEDDLNLFNTFFGVNWRRIQFLVSPSFSWAWHSSAPACLLVTLISYLSNPTSDRIFLLDFFAKNFISNTFTKGDKILQTMCKDLWQHTPLCIVTYWRKRPHFFRPKTTLVTCILYLSNPTSDRSFLLEFFAKNLISNTFTKGDKFIRTTCKDLWRTRTFVHSYLLTHCRCKNWVKSFGVCITFRIFLTSWEQ